MRDHPPAGLAILLALAALVSGCSGSGSRAPCLTNDPMAITFPFQRLENMSHEAEGDTELARFAFDPAALGEVTVTVEPALGPFVEFNTGQATDVQGDRLWSVRIEGLVGGASTDQVRATPSETHRIRNIVQVVDQNAFRWVVGTAAGACVRLGNEPNDAVVVVHVSAP